MQHARGLGSSEKGLQASGSEMWKVDRKHEPKPSEAHQLVLSQNQDGGVQPIRYISHSRFQGPLCRSIPHHVVVRSGYGVCPSYYTHASDCSQSFIPEVNHFESFLSYQIALLSFSFGVVQFFAPKEFNDDTKNPKKYIPRQQVGNCRWRRCKTVCMTG